MPPDRAAGRADTAAIAGALALLWAGLAAALLATGGRVSLDHDWLTHLLHHRFARDAWLSGEVPLWSAFVSGGYPIAGHPEFPLSSPTLLPTLLLGERLGIKVAACFFLAVGAGGTAWLARVGAGVGRAGAIAAGAALLSGSWFSWSLTDGNYVELHALVFPAVAAGALAGGRWVALSGALMALVVFDGNVALLSGGLVTAALLLALPADGELRARRLGRLVGAGALALALSAGKLPSLVALLSRDSRGIDDYAEAADVWYGGLDLLSALVALHPPGEWPYPLSRLHLGPLALLLAAAALPLVGRRALPWLGLGGVAAWLAMGPAAPVDLYRLLWHLPLFHSIKHPAKAYDLYLLLGLAVLIGLAVDGLAALAGRRLRRRPGLARWAAAGVAALALAPAYLRLPGLIYRGFPDALPAPEPAAAYYQIQGRDLTRYEGRPLAAEAYPNLLAGVGVIDWKPGVLQVERATPRFWVEPDGSLVPARGYRGEAWFLEGEGEIRSVTPGFSGVEVAARVEGEGAWIGVNQNADIAFSVEGGALKSEAGLLGAEVEGPGEVTLKFQIQGWPTKVGLGVQLLGWLGLLGWAAPGGATPPSRRRSAGWRR